MIPIKLTNYENIQFANLMQELKDRLSDVRDRLVGQCIKEMMSPSIIICENMDTKYFREELERIGAQMNDIPFQNLRMINQMVTVSINSYTAARIHFTFVPLIGFEAVADPRIEVLVKWGTESIGDEKDLKQFVLPNQQ